MPKIPPPKTGWYFTTLTDLNYVDPLNIKRKQCDRCRRDLRFVHWLAHPNCPDKLGVGACCALKLATGYDPKTQERLAAKEAAQLKRFITPARWKANPARGTLTRKLRGARVTIRESNYLFSFVIAGDWQNGFQDLIAAQRAALAELRRREIHVVR